MGGAIGAAQGYWIAYHKIPSFIVTLAGMLVFRGLALWLLGGQSVGPFPPQFQLLSSGFIPDVFANPGFNITSMLVGIVLVALMIYFSIRGRAKREKHGYEGEPFALFIAKNLIIAGIILFLTYLLSSYKGSAERSGRHVAIDRALRLRDQAHDRRPPHLRHGRQ